MSGLESPFSGLSPLAVDSDSGSAFSTIVADPPWPFDTESNIWLEASPTHRPNSWDSPKSGPSARRRYGCMSMDELCAMEIPAAKNAHLYLWTVNSFMVEAHDLARAWGFKPKTICTWVKMKADGTASMKTGYWFRGATEHFLFCVRGSLRLHSPEALPTAYFWPRAAHSVKPDAFYDLVEMASPGPYLDVFSRRARLGWQTWGNESLHGTDSMPAIEATA